MSKRFYITTAIDYVNGQPHLGHAYEKIIADVITRARRSLGQEVFFLTGLDEHGQKVQQAAITEGKTPQAYCDQLAADWQAFAKKLELTNDDFVRTTQPRHKEFVQAILSKLNDAGHFYKATYTGFYSAKEETFLTEKDRRPDGTFDPSYGEVVELKEDNYYFKLGAQQQWLIDYIETNPDFISPSYRRNEVLGFLKNNTLEDLCISRPLARLNWGIPIPFDPNFVTYVWFDALVNYISIAAAHGDETILSAINSSPVTRHPSLSLWPADIHVIGKDILKFHAVYWPIMLKAMGLPLPKQILVHGWWQKDGAKISKSTGNVIDPVAVINEWGLDAFRFYVLRELDIGPDGNWTDAGFRSRYQAELANGLGNLVNRSLSMLKRYRNGVVPARSNELAADAAKAADETRALFKQSQLQSALQSIWGLVNRANKYVDETAPFKLAKDPAQAQRLDEVLYNLTETCRVLAVLLWPFLPGTATKIYAQLGLSGSPDKLDAATWGGLQQGQVIGEPAPLFPRKDILMDLNHILDEEKRICELIKRKYVDSTNNSWPIYDGIFNPKEYISSSPRILWILKEPYDGGDAFEGGDWKLTDDAKTDEMSRWKAFQPMCYTNYGIWKGIHDWDKMPWLKDCEEMRSGLKKIALINISKLPGLKQTPPSRIVEAYQKHRGIIFDQIKTYDPNIIFACDPHANLILKDLGFSESQWKSFGSASSIQISSEQRLVWVWHPSQRFVKRHDYVNDAIRAATIDLGSQATKI